MNEEVTALLQAVTVAVSALLATHPEPAKLRPAFETLAAKAPHPHPAYQATIGTLRKAMIAARTNS